ncbi:MAG: M20/M25/M40 family metallo-hydrolase [Candidatus Eisenbacteria bacterium]
MRGRSILGTVLAATAVIAAAAVTVPAGPAADDAPPRPGFGERHRDVRVPLAFATGDATPLAERTPEARASARRPIEHIFSLPPESLISALIESTNVHNVAATIERLEAYGTRYVTTDSCLAAGRWLRERFVEYGYADVRTDTFRTWTWQDSTQAWNILAVKQGTSRASEYVVLGGHYDSVTTQNFSDPDAPAPGAEDNATGVAGVLEAARLLADVETERSIIFACWSAEEEGLWGSRAFVADALAESMDVVLYLNMDAIGYLAGPAPDVYVMADSSALAVAAWMCDVATRHTIYEFVPTVQPLGASDHNSFWESGYNVVDSQVDPVSPYMHTPEDVVANLDVAFATAVAAVNIVAAVSVAGVVGEDLNLPPETTLAENCAALGDVVTVSPTFEWDAVDFDGVVAAYDYSLVPAGEPADWRSLPASQRAISFSALSPGEYEFAVRAVDGAGLPDPSPAEHVFAAADTFSPVLTVSTNFLPSAVTFRGPAGGGRGDRTEPLSVFESERLIFAVRADASHYCGRADSVAVAVGGAHAWGPWRPSPYDFVLRPTPGDTAVRFRTRDRDGAASAGMMRLDVVPAPMDLPLIHIDDWMGGDVPEATHDAFYSSLLDGHGHVEWDPLEHIEGGLPSLPSMEELGRHRTVFWSVGPGFEFLRDAQAESAYHYVEGFVRAGGNLILEGQSSLTALAGVDPYAYDPFAPLPAFVSEHVGVDSMWNSGNVANVSYPETYGWAFLGGIALSASPFDDVPVDTLGKWADNFLLYGGVPWCETVRPAADARRLYLFDSFLNPTLNDVPCATLRYAGDGTGMVAYFGFPFYYIEDAAAGDMVDALLAEMAGWQEPSELVFFDADAEPGSVTLTWYLSPAGGPAGCHLERSPPPDGQGAGYARLNDDLIAADEAGRFSFEDATVDPASTYSYRLVVVEQWGGESVHGPWTVEVPDVAPVDALAAPVPNPATRSVGIHYTVGSDHRRVVVGIYDCTGRLVRLLRREVVEAGEHDEVWDGTNEAGRQVASGVYFVRAELGGRSFHRKVVMLR